MWGMRLPSHTPMNTAEMSTVKREFLAYLTSVPMRELTGRVHDGDALELLYRSHSSGPPSASRFFWKWKTVMSDERRRSEYLAIALEYPFLSRKNAAHPAPIRSRTRSRHRSWPGCPE